MSERPYTKERLSELGLEPRSILLFQDPAMQWRTLVTFQKVWQVASYPAIFRSDPTFVPRLEMRDGMVSYAAAMPSGLWSPERFLSLILGEIPRLRDDERGYGPRGRDFIPHVEIPLEIEAAYEHVLELLKSSGNAKERILS